MRFKKRNLLASVNNRRSFKEEREALLLKQNQNRHLINNANRSEKDMKKLISKIVGDIYFQTVKSIEKNVTVLVDRKALIEELDIIYGKKKK